MPLSPLCPVGPGVGTGQQLCPRGQGPAQLGDFCPRAGGWCWARGLTVALVRDAGPAALRQQRRECVRAGACFCPGEVTFPPRPLHPPPSCWCLWKEPNCPFLNLVTLRPALDQPGREPWCPGDSGWAKSDLVFPVGLLARKVLACGEATPIPRSCEVTLLTPLPPQNPQDRIPQLPSSRETHRG